MKKIILAVSLLMAFNAHAEFKNPKDVGFCAGALTLMGAGKKGELLIYGSDFPNQATQAISNFTNLLKDRNANEKIDVLKMGLDSCDKIGETELANEVLSTFRKELSQ